MRRSGDRPCKGSTFPPGADVSARRQERRWSGRVLQRDRTADSSRKNHPREASGLRRNGISISFPGVARRAPPALPTFARGLGGRASALAPQGPVAAVCHGPVGRDRALVVVVDGGRASGEVVRALRSRLAISDIWAPAQHQIRGARTPSLGAYRVGLFEIEVTSTSAPLQTMPRVASDP